MKAEHQRISLSSHTRSQSQANFYQSTKSEVGFHSPPSKSNCLSRFSARSVHYDRERRSLSRQDNTKNLEFANRYHGIKHRRCYSIDSSIKTENNVLLTHFYRKQACLASSMDRHNYQSSHPNEAQFKEYKQMQEIKGIFRNKDLPKSKYFFKKKQKVVQSLLY